MICVYTVDLPPAFQLSMYPNICTSFVAALDHCLGTSISYYAGWLILIDLVYSESCDRTAWMLDLTSLETPAIITKQQSSRMDQMDHHM